jgi:protein-tyrosine phosphatase
VTTVPRFVDVHAHVVPSGDDGARTVEEGVTLCALAASAGTAILFATPHVHAAWDSYPWSDAREELYERSFLGVRDAARLVGVDLRRGREVFPSEVLAGDAGTLRLEGTEAVLVEFPGSWLDMPGQLELTARACRRIEAEGLTPVLAHPERCREVTDEPRLLEDFVAAGRLLCLNATSVTGRHGSTAENVAWELLDGGLVALVASDGHRASRPPTLDEAWHLVAERLGDVRARPLFDGSALPWTEAPVERVAC